MERLKGGNGKEREGKEKRKTNIEKERRREKRERERRREKKERDWWERFIDGRMISV